MPLSPVLRAVVLAGVCLGCARAQSTTQGIRPEHDSTTAASPGPEPQPVEPALGAFLSGWMPLDASGVNDFASRFPKYDGRGVIIAILDSGLDTDTPGLERTSNGKRKVLDLRDFSGEGLVRLDDAKPMGDTVVVASRWLAGFGRVAGYSVSQEYFVGAISEIPLGTPLLVDQGATIGSDLNGNGRLHDTLAVVVTRAQNGWVLFADTDGDGSLADERPVYDYLVSGQTFGWATEGALPPLAVAANFAEAGGRPRLDLMFDTSGHGTHVAGIAAGHDLYGVKGFDGVAPGAWLLGLKIANNGRGGISVDGSMVAAMAYAIDFAERRRAPLVINLSFGVGNAREGTARIDQLVDSLLAAHPGVVMTVSAGNDGPGLSTMGFPASALRPITVGATFPLVFLARPAGGPKLADPVAFFSARGGELAKPDVVAPGVAYSTVPQWNTGNERNAGTSMAAPYVAGLAARLESSAAESEIEADAALVKRALMVTARPLVGTTYVDDGTGVPDLPGAWRWLDRAARGSVRGPAVSVGMLVVIDTGTTPVPFRIPLADASGEQIAIESSDSWLDHPRSLVAREVVDLNLFIRPDAVPRGRALTGMVSGWGEVADDGPVFRAVVTAVNPLPVNEPTQLDSLDIPAGGIDRVFFWAEAGRPFQVQVGAGDAFDRMFTSLHEPGGMPYRGENGLLAGPLDDAAVYQVDAGDVVSGIYQIVAAASPVAAGQAQVVIRQAPFHLDASTAESVVTLKVKNLDEEPQSATPRAALVGGVWQAVIEGNGGAEHRLPFTLPQWARVLEIDVRLEPGDWELFTDYGVTVLDTIGRVVADAPLDYPTGRLRATLGEQHAGLPVVLSLLPGMADIDDLRPWRAMVDIRLYAAAAVPLSRTGGVAGPIDWQPGQVQVTDFDWRPSPWELGAAFVPLGLFMTETTGPTWTRQVALPPAERQ